MKFAVPGVASAVAGALLGVIAVFIVVTATAQNSRPEISHGDASSSLLNNVEYGAR
ncbi:MULTISPECIES: DUF2613 domain-containing protein [Nocardia]|jgi:hypothetical protein|uniref:DUF2613 domain-containing protein n=2 Tax=Nocardia TaxID=1817 RepID=A0A2T2Z4U2_9NOCA|nr:MULTISPECIES: DUF2613 domain-containing protein [Nocardia]MBF6143818.1 DUF2613 domain-containing protein [Nocardia nova]MBF6245009.1 DUF2613 domain-containing protein [Nocardia elegans]MBF6449912.1 DUF2613 domain-containing protein [Nocardia elegans]MBV7701357.1 DUF2613 domain-containing protein [Nocardia nova]MDN2499316.1 DUF2613 family protein [Nocardia nova]